jgi:hypothetical protein
MRFEDKLDSGIIFYYELSGKQDNKLFAVKFSYGSYYDGKDHQFHAETIVCKTAEEMRKSVAELKRYCLDKNFVQVKSGKS